jgi:hypothetical protein
VVGDRGPGGGIVFYISAAPFTSAGSTCNTACKYLEVAPAGWNNGGVVADDPRLAWSSNDETVTGQNLTNTSPGSEGSEPDDETFNWKIGQGFYNTSLMEISGATSDAQAAVLAYAGGGFTGQWFIPSINELNELCKYAWGQTTGVLTVKCTSGGTFKSTANAGTDLGGFVSSSYWSSSDRFDEDEEEEEEYFLAWNQDFRDANQGFPERDREIYVRPIRAF